MDLMKKCLPRVIKPKIKRRTVMVVVMYVISRFKTLDSKREVLVIPPSIISLGTVKKA